MANLNEIVVSCDDPDEIIRATNIAVRQLPEESKWQFVRIRSDYFRRFGYDGLFARFNGRTVASILAEYDGDDGGKPIVSGERGGLKFALYEAPKKEDREQEPDDSTA